MKRIFILALLVSGSTFAKKSDLDLAQRLTAQSAKTAIKISDSNLDLRAELDSYDALRPANKLSITDNFIRVYIDKKTGESTVQIYQAIDYSGSGWRHYNSATMETNDGPVAADFKKVSSKVIYCGSSRYSSSCSYLEQMVLIITEAHLRDIASSPMPWRYKINAQAGDDYVGIIYPQEAAGMVMAIDEYRAQKNLVFSN